MRSKQSVMSIQTSAFCVRRHEHLAHLVRQQVFDQQLGEDVRVARRGVDGVQAGVARGAVVGVIQVAIAAEAHGRVLADDGVGSKAADLAHDVAAQRERVGQRAVLVGQEHDVTRAERVRGVDLLGAPRLGQPIRD